MKLYYAQGACSMAPHIVLREAGFSFELEKVDLATKQTASGTDFAKINPKGYVPVLKLDNGETLTEVAVVLQYIADLKPQAGLAPAMGTLERYRLMEWLTFVSSEIHKTFGPLFHAGITAEWKENQLSTLGKRFDYLSDRLGDMPYLMGEKFSIADAYLFTVLRWCNFLAIDLGKWPKLKDYADRVASRPAVREAMTAEGLLQ